MYGAHLAVITARGTRRAMSPLTSRRPRERPLRLIHTKTVGSGLAHLTYERAREA